MSQELVDYGFAPNQDEREILSQYITDNVRSYWKEYEHWVKGKRDEKPTVNADIQLYWKVQSQLRAERRARENRELYEYVSELQHNRRDPNTDLELWNSKQVADFFGVESTGTILNWRKRGWLTGFQPNGENGRWAFNSRDIQDMVEDAKQVETELRRFMPRVLHRAKHQGRQG